MLLYCFDIFEEAYEPGDGLQFELTHRQKINNKDWAMNLVYKNEKALFTISLIISVIFWIVAWVFVVIYAPFIFLGYLFVQSAFISYIKGTGVKLSAEQFPVLNKRIRRCCIKLKIKRVPQAYILSADGILNAFATKFLGNHFIVLYSDVVDAFDSQPDAIDFYFGHELGHVKRNHLNWGVVLWPASILPLLGTAYSRAREYTCDLHGLACCANQKDAIFALGLLAAGSKRWKSLNVAAYASQSQETGGFWMSFHELISTYPWLCKRVERVRAISTNENPELPGRNFFSYLFSLFVPNLGMGGSPLGIMVVVAIIGILAAVALPAYQDYMVTANTKHFAPAFELGNQISEKMDPYIIENQALPQSLAEIGLDNNLSNKAVTSVGIVDNTVVLTVIGIKGGTTDTVVYEPYVSEDMLNWNCSGGTLDIRYRPAECKE